MTKWEYYRLLVALEEDAWVISYLDQELEYTEETLDNILAELGQQGWELVSTLANISTTTLSLPLGVGSKTPYVRTSSEAYLFKRPIA